MALFQHPGRLRSQSSSDISGKWLGEGCPLSLHPGPWGRQLPLTYMPAVSHELRALTQGVSAGAGEALSSRGVSGSGLGSWLRGPQEDCLVPESAWPGPCLHPQQVCSASGAREFCWVTYTAANYGLSFSKCKMA